MFIKFSMPCNMPSQRLPDTACQTNSFQPVLQLPDTYMIREYHIITFIVSILHIKRKNLFRYRMQGNKTFHLRLLSRFPDITSPFSVHLDVRGTQALHVGKSQTCKDREKEHPPAEFHLLMLHGECQQSGDVALLQKTGTAFLCFIFCSFKRVEANHPPADSLVHQAAQPAKMRVDGSRGITLFFQVETIFVKKAMFRVGIGMSVSLLLLTKRLNSLSQ